MEKRPHILITNDDGIHTPGIHHLWQALHPFADVTIVAPWDERSASGLAFTIKHPLMVKEVSWEGNSPAWGVSGTPADCIKLALSQFTQTPPDIIVSGINPGSNAGRNLLYSGTVGGVIEGIMHDIPGIAFSTQNYFDPDFPPCIPYITKIVQHVLKSPLPAGTLLNVNFPDADYQGLKFTRQGMGMWVEQPDKRIHPTEGHTYYWIGQTEVMEEKEEDTDTWWIQHGYITCVPVHVAELTDHRVLKQRKDSFESLFV